jgi:hypothetical protein
MRSGSYHWKYYSCFYRFASCDIYTYTQCYVAVLQDCLEVLPSLMNNCQFPFLLLASRVFPDKMMGCILNRKLSLLIFLWSYVRIFCPMQTIMCREWATQCVYEGQLNLIMRNLLVMITESSPTFSSKLSRLHILLGNKHHHIAVLFTSVEGFVRELAVKWSAVCQWRRSNNLTCV